MIREACALTGVPKKFCTCVDCMKPQIALRPCPFCGCADEMTIMRDSELHEYCDWNQDSDPTFAVVCNASRDGNHDIHHGCGGAAGFKPTEAEAIAAWNARAAPEPSDGAIYQAGSAPMPDALRDAIEHRNEYPQIRKLFEMISADNSGCTADEIEALLATLSDEQMQIIAAGEQTEMDNLKEQLQRDGPPGVADALWNMAAVAFDG